MTDIARTAATQTQVSDIAAQIIEETVRRCQELPEYAGRPAWEQVIRDVIQKHLVAMLAMKRERCAVIGKEAALYSGCPADFIADEIAEAIRRGDE